LNYNFKALM